MTNQKSVQEETESRVKSSSLLSKNIKIQMYRTIILSVVCFVMV